MREAVAHHHDFDEHGLILHERSPINPKSVYATAKVAADFLTMNYHDAFGIPGVVTRMFNNYGPQQNPRYVTGTIVTQALTRETIELGHLEPLSRLLLLHGWRPRAPDRRRARHPRRRLRLRPGREPLDGRLVGADHPDRRGERLLAGRTRGRDHTEARFRPGASDAAALRVGAREADTGNGLAAEGVLGGRTASHDRLVRAQSGPLDRARRLADAAQLAAEPVT